MVSNEFILFGSTHLLTLLIIFGVSFTFSFYVKNNYDANRYAMFEKTLAYLLIFNELLKPFYLNYFSPDAYNWTNTIPLHACHFSSYATGLFLLTRNQKFFDFAYFWGLGGGTMALFTPDIELTFPDLDFITLFSGHGLLFFALLYIAIGIKQNITFESYKNAIKFSLYILPVVYIINVLVGGEPGFEANLWYLMKAPAGESLMSFFPSPPLHIIPLFPIVMFVFYLLYLPYKLKERKNV
ncbi:TIGR02206 family membrane protein [Candidatus Marinimicrobia bacterium]|nr:TIGR02206 family membrane protein [Candidatus Neomarinimicrobiota bacterium]